MDFKEFRAKTVEDAEIDAARLFGVVTADLEIEVVEKGSSGFLGLGAKQAVIRARVKDSAASEGSAATAEAAKEEAPKAEAKPAAAVKEEKKPAAPVSEESKDLIEDTKAYLDKLFAKKTAEVTRNQEAARIRLRENFEQNREKWVDDIVSRVLSFEEAP